jgi:hypothetical protein
MKPITLLSILPLSTIAHVMMRDPPPRRSKYADYYVQNGLVDYNIMAPINSGYSFPCKGFPQGPSTKTVGKNVQITLEGSAIHGGGHCQFGISYDNANFVVLKTVVRNCLLNSMSYDFDLPDDVSNTKTIVFWTWINAIGNREYYMDCADVNVVTNSHSNSPASVSGYELFVANLPGFTTIPEFPRPEMYDGSDLLLSHKPMTITPPNSPEPQFSSHTHDPSTPKAPPQTPQPFASPPNTPKTLPPSPQPSATPPSTSKTLPPSPQPSATPPSTPKTPPPSPSSECTTGDMRCGASGGFDTCVFDKWVWRACAPGTVCKNVANNDILCDFA